MIMKRIGIDYDYLFHVVPGHYLVMLNDAPHFTIVEMNHGFLTLLGLTRDELYQRSIWDAFPESDHEASRQGTRQLRKSLERCAQTGLSDDVGVIRYDVKNKSGHFVRRLWATTIFPIIVDGEIKGILLSTDDVTQRFDDDISTQAQIEHLTEINKAQDEFISIASHQLRTPATGVKQYLGMLSEGLFGELSEEQLDIIHRAYESNERQLRVVTDLLKVAQVDSGKLTLRKEVTDINQLLHFVIRDNLDMFKSREQTLVFQPSAEKAEALVDGNIVRTVTENLLDNASKYTEEGKRIWVTVKNHSDTIVVQVIDEGVGVSHKKQVDLFKKFSRIENELSTKVGGTGLGLYWAKQSMDAHGGALRYYTNRPRGSVFEVILPKTDKPCENSYRQNENE